MAELAHHVIHPATSGAGVGRSLRDRLQDEICRFDPERLSPGWRISKAYGYVYLDLAEFRSHGFATTTWRVARSWRRVGEMVPAQVSLHAVRTKSGERLSPERGLGSRVRTKSGEWPRELSQAGCSLAIREI